MNRSKTPDWLIEIQNKSWEPEILISGITLTFLFIISNYIFNFYGMLIQEFNVKYIVGKNLYIISIIILTGLKVGLIFHLILRGIWTGFVGLSYVFPEGVNKQNMKVSKRNINYHKPEHYVIKLEKICSILFSFIFSSIIFVGTASLVFVPIAVLYIIGLDIQYIKYIILYVIVPLAMIIGILALLSDTILKNSKFMLIIKNSILDNILNTYFTNIGIKKTLSMFVLFFAFIGLLSFPDISKFDFNNEQRIDISSQANIVQLNKAHYQDFRYNKLRISKAAIDQFCIKGNTIGLFVSFYKEDLYTVRNLNENPTFLDELDMDSDSSEINLKTLYQIYIDDKIISELRWYSTENDYTNQKGFITSIPTDIFSNGYHELKINKILWINKLKKIELVKNWDIIPFELEKKTF